jgi:hypothetical protein
MSYFVTMVMAIFWTKITVFPAGALLVNTSAKIAFWGVSCSVAATWLEASSKAEPS